MATRRELLLAAGAGALGAASGANAYAAPASQRSGEPSSDRSAIRRACKLGMVAEGETLRDKFQLLADLGYDGVEPGSPGAIDTDELLAAKEATGLAVPGVIDTAHWRDTLGDPDPAVRAKGRAALETALRDAAAWGASTALLVPAVVGERIAYGDAYERCRAEIAGVVPLAEEMGVAIAFENVWNNFLLSPLEAAAFVDSFGSEQVGWYLDVGNLVRFAWPEHWVAALGPRVLKVDVKGYSRTKQNDEGLWRGFDVGIAEAGDDSGWSRVMAALDATAWGCAGERWFSAEVGGGDRARLAEVLAQLDRAIAS